MRTTMRSSLGRALSSLVVLTLMVSCSDRASVVEDAGMDRGVADRGQGPADGLAADRAVADQRLTDGGGDLAQVDGAGTLSCDPAAVTCKSQPSPCTMGEIRVVLGDCWGDCVPIEQCGDVPAQPDCDQTQISCEIVPPVCPVRYVPTHNGNSCFGPCVPITTCACSGSGPATQCPGDYTCHNNAQRCGLS